MKPALLLLSLTALLPIAASAAYTYDYPAAPAGPDPMTSASTQNWYVNGPVSTTSSGYTSPGDSGVVSTATSLGTSAYEVKMQLTLTATGGYYAALLRASNDSVLAYAGTHYGIEVSYPTISGSSCTASLNFYKTIAGYATILSSTAITCHSGMVLRAVIQPGGTMMAYIDNLYIGAVADSQITGGAPGVGVTNSPAGNYITNVQFGHFDTTPPNTINTQTVGISSFPNEVDFQWQGVSDDPNGIGMYAYQMYRYDPGNPNAQWVAGDYQPQFVDTAVSPGVTYTYLLQAVDWHWNVSSAFITVQTPATGIDARQVGMRPTGSYWGGGGENIDMRSGNLNYTVPLIKAKGRGWTLPFNLTYNSQNWRTDGGGTWNLGRDSGYGYGWKLQAGALVPVYNGFFNLHHYLFIDATGAEYRLDVQNGNIWTSKESVYMEYDSSTSRLYFPDGTYWVFGCTSAGTEQDAGVQYPTLVQDTNGNQVTVTYQSGTNTTWSNSSARILSISDVASTGNTNSYNFSYSSDALPHLTAITSPIYPAESYAFSYWASATLTAGTNTSLTFGQAQMLYTVVNTKQNLGTSYWFNSSGELVGVVFPYGGNLQWSYQNATYQTNRTHREVYQRFLQMSNGATQYTYTIAHDTWSCTPTVIHCSTTMQDVTGNGKKAWAFETNSAAIGFGLQKAFEDRDLTSGEVAKTHSDFTWALDDPNTFKRPYISSTLTQLDPGTPSQVQKRSDQAVDIYGNVTSMSLYDFGSPNAPGSPTRTYANTYLSDSSPTSVHPTGSNYNAEHIHNRLLTSTVTQGGQTTTLTSNVYDRYSDVGCPANQYSFNFNTYSWVLYPGIGAIDSTTAGNQFRGNVTTNNGLDITRSMCYDGTGNVLAVNAAGHWTTVQSSSQTNYSTPGAITTGSLTTTLNWTSFLAPSSQTGPNGDTAGMGYDSAGRPSTTTTPHGASTTYTYSTSAPQITAVVNTNDTNTNGRKTATTVDGFGRTTQVDSIDAGGGTRSRVQMVYTPCGCSPLGKLSKQSRPSLPTDQVIYWTTYTYDGLGRTTIVLAPDGLSQTTYTYAGNTVTVKDAATNARTFTMDAFGNLTKAVEPDSSQTSTAGQATTTYTYDALNHLIGVNMPRQMPGGNTVTQTRTFTFAGAYLISANNPENGTVNYGYYADGSLATKWDAKGQQQNYFLQYLHDSYGRVTTLQSVPGTPSNPLSSPAPTVLRTYTYDTNPSDDPNYSQNALGRLTRVQYNAPAAASVLQDYDNNWITFSPDNVTEMYSYSVPGQVVAKRLRVQRPGDRPSSTASADLNATWTYNNEGNLTGTTYPGDPNGLPTPPSYSYSYDGMGRLSGMTGSAAVSGVQYNAAGQMTAGLDTRTYDPATGQLKSISAASVNVTYTYPDSGHNIGKISSATYNGEQVSYAYDTLNRLIAAQAGSTWGQGFKYDPFGNLTDKYVLPGTTGSVPTLSVVPDAGTNHLGSVDANGNATGYGINYDLENRLIAASGAQYTYDRQNKRIFSCTNSCASETYYFYAPSGKLIAQFTPVYTAPMKNQYLQLVPATLVFQNGLTRAYFGSRLLGNEDRLGSRGKYFPYGEDNGSQNPASDNVKFATYTRDSATGFDYADQRYYAATSGRFLTPDPYMASAGPKSPQSWNRYAYVGGDPTNFNDPTGRFAASPDGTTGGDCLHLYVDGIPYGCAEGGTGGGGGSDGNEGLGVCPAGSHFVAAENSCASDFSDDDPPTCDHDFPKYEVTFVLTNYSAAVSLGAGEGIPNDWVLAWSALESFWGTRGIVVTNGNYIGWRGRGDIPCGRNTNKTFGCFSGFAASLSTALSSTSNYFQYGGETGVAAGSILFDQYQSGASVTQAFDTLAHAGYTPDAGYGAGVAVRDREVLRIEDCLRQLGMISR